MCILKDVNMMSVSDDASNRKLATGSGNSKSKLLPKENGNDASQNVNDRVPVSTDGANKGLSMENSSPAWLSKTEHDPGPKRIKLPPVTVPENAKRKQKRITNKNLNQGSKGKLNTAIEPLQEET